MVFNDTGIPVKWSASGFISKTEGGGGGGGGNSPIPPEVIHYAALVSDLQSKCRATVTKLFTDEETEDPSLVYFRLRTKLNEIIVAPSDGCTLVVLQSASKDDGEAKGKKEKKAA
mmetsp:Transcript_3615/g.13208  ORF Transcript_3615/g.13208 Transcript_3615/m.13208 type:complete len:115 (-) Transcript_3615:149-493(-)